MVGATAALACSKPTTPSADLARDIEAASSAPTLTLAPIAGRRDVVSAVELSPQARRAPAPSRQQPAPRASRAAYPLATVATPTVNVTPPATVVAAVPEIPAPANDNAAQSRRPVPVQAAHQGRYKTEAEVFRDAPFPITP